MAPIMRTDSERLMREGIATGVEAERKRQIESGGVPPATSGEAPEVGVVRPLAEEVLSVAETLSPLPIPRDDVALAVRLTIRSTDHFVDDVLAMRADVLNTPPNVPSRAQR